MAAELIVNPSILHTPEHDLESVFWVLLWLTLLYTKTSWDIRLRSSILTEVMNPKVYPTGGGTPKLHFIRDAWSTQNLFSDRSPGLNVLIKGIHGVFCRRYRERALLQYRTKQKEISDMSADIGMDESSDESMDEGMDESSDESMDEGTEERMDESPDSDEIMDESPNEIGIVTHAALVEIINDALKNKSNWASKDVAKLRAVQMPR